MATKKANTVGIEGRLDNLKAQVKELNGQAVNISDQLVEASLETGEKWQKLMGKALNQGTTLFGKQQDLMFSTLEEVKAQFSTGNKRFKKLVGLDATRVRKAERLAKNAKQKVTKVKVEASSLSDLAKDDLKVITGVGPKMEQLLNEAGIFTYYQLSMAPIKDLKPILDAAGPRFKAQNPADWKKEAKKLA